MAWYVDGSAGVNGDGSLGSPYNAVPGNSFAEGTWYLKAGSTLTMGGTGLTTGHSAVIGRYGTGANPIILSSASIILNSSTATGVSLTDLSIVRSGSVTGTGWNASQTSGGVVTRCTFTGSAENITASSANGLTVQDSTFNGGAGSYGIKSASTTIVATGWVITRNTFNTAGHIVLMVSNASNAAGSFQGLSITNNVFNESASSAIILSCYSNLTLWTNTLQIVSGNRIVMVNHTGATNNNDPGSWPALVAGQKVLLSGFRNPANFIEVTVASPAFTQTTVAGDTLNVVETIVAEAAGIGMGLWLIDTARAYVDTVISYNTLVGQDETPMLLESQYHATVDHNDISGGYATNYGTAAAIEMQNWWGSGVVEYNNIHDIGGVETIDNGGIFLDGGTVGATVRNNTIYNLPKDSGTAGDGIKCYFAKDCIVELNYVSNCHYGISAGGPADVGMVIRNNTVTNCLVGTRIDTGPAVGAYTLTTNNYSSNVVDVFDWPAFNFVPALATAVTMTGRDYGEMLVASVPFNIGVNGTVGTETVVVTPSDGAGGGVFTPTSVSLLTGYQTATFTYTPTSEGAKTISITNDQGLTNPTSIVYSSESNLRGGWPQPWEMPRRKVIAPPPPPPTKQKPKTKAQLAEERRLERKRKSDLIRATIEKMRMEAE